MKEKFKKKSVLIGHVFGFSPENVIIPFPYAWIASLVVGFCTWISTLRVIFRLLCFFTIFCVLATHVFCKMAASPPRRVFAHKRTVRLIIENDMRIDSL